MMDGAKILFQGFLRQDTNPLPLSSTMGNTPVTVGLRTEKQAYKAGDSVNGTVYVSINKQAQPAQAITLRIQGREHALVHYTTQETRREGRDEHTHHRDHYDESTNDFLRVEYPLHTFPTQQLLPGQYEFPFSIFLPSNLPSTMYCRQGESHCSVEYKLIATLVKPSRGIFSSDPHSEQKLNISAVPPPGEDLERYVVAIAHVPVMSCCCHNKGLMALQARFSKTTVQPQDTIDIRFRCQNQSSVTVKTVRVQLEEITEWTATRGRNEVVKRILDRREMDASQFPELAKQRRSRRGQYEDFGAAPEQVPFQDGSSADDPNYYENWKHAAIHVPAMIRDSYQGQGIKVRHLVSVQLITKGCCTIDPDATTCVQVYQSLPPRPVATSTTTSAKPSAPSSLYDEFSATPLAPSTSIQPSAPASQWDAAWNDTISTATPSAPCDIYDSSFQTPMAEAQLLPPDWNAQTAEVVTIPMAEAIVLDTPAPWNTQQ